MAIVFTVLALVWVLLTILMRSTRVSRAPAAERRGRGGAAGGPALTAPVAGDRPPAGAPPDLDPRLLAAITIAIVRHEEARRLQAAPAMRSYWPGSLLFASRWVAAGRTRQGQSWRRRR